MTAILAKNRLNLKMKAPTLKGTREANAQLVVSSQTIRSRTSYDRFVVGNLSTQTRTLVVTASGTQANSSTWMGVLGLIAPWPGGSAAAGRAVARPVFKRNAKPSAR